MVTKEYLFRFDDAWAASMQGKYSGIRTLIQNVNPKAMYIRSFEHILNLVIINTSDSTQMTSKMYWVIYKV